MWSKWNLKGFFLLESLVAFIIFSLVLMLYLPSYQRELARLEQLKNQANQWQLMADLVRIVNDEGDEKELIHHRIAAFQNENPQINFWWTQEFYYILSVDGGEPYEVQLLKIQ